MSYTTYCLVYVLNNYYSGNKSKMAADMHMANSDFFKVYRRVVMEGHDSPTMMERLTMLCGRKRIDMNEIWSRFYSDPNLEPTESDACPYYYIMRDLDNKLDELYEHIYQQQQTLKITEAAKTLVNEIRGACCGCGQDQDASTICSKYKLWRESGVADKDDIADCPCHHISAMLYGLKDS